MLRGLLAIVIVAGGLLGAGALGGCASDSCTAPPAFAYSCEPQADTANACVGGPMLGGTQHDADKNYPVGCFAGAGQCVDGEVEPVHTCHCIVGIQFNDWVCSQ
jgi:hypothetical protein